MLDNIHRVIVAFIYYNTQWNYNIGLLLCFHEHELLPSTLQSLLTASNKWEVSCGLLAMSWVHGTCRNTNMQCDWLVLTGFYTYIFMPVVKYVSMYVDLPYFGKHAWHMIAWVFLHHHALSYPSKTCTLSSLVLYTLHTCHNVFSFLSSPFMNVMQTIMKNRGKETGQYTYAQFILAWNVNFWYMYLSPLNLDHLSWNHYGP